jgi:putative ABC transport system ATP-binding protein
MESLVQRSASSFSSSSSSAPTSFSGSRSSDGTYGAVIDAHNLHKTYLMGVEGVAAVRGISFSIQPGEFVLLYGTSGGGKTTLLNIIGLIDQPTKGRLRVCGVDVRESTSDAVYARTRLENIGFVFQAFNLVSSLSAVENVELPMALLGKLDAAERRLRAMQLLQSVGMASRASHLPSQMSGGEQQRVTIARAIANNPKLLILDEPTGDLDTQNTEIVLRLLLDLNVSSGITVLMVSHDVALRSIADRVLHLRDGKLTKEEVVCSDTKQEFRRRIAATEHDPGSLFGALPGVAGLQEGEVCVVKKSALEYKVLEHHSLMWSATQTRRQGSSPLA